MKKALVFIALFLLNFASQAQPSLASGDRQDLLVTINGASSTYTVIKDSQVPKQWYYVPTQPRLYIKNSADGNTPEISVLKYQFSDLSSPDGLSEGGVLQFACTFAAPDAAMVELKSQLEKKLGSDIMLSALPIKSANASIYSNADGKLITNIYGAGVAPTFATQKIPFTLNLTKMGADFESALIGGSTKSNTGVPVAIVVTYEGLTPPATLKIHANYKSIYTHYSSDKVLAAKASYFGLFGASSTVRWTDIQNDLKQDGSLTVERVGSDGSDDKILNDIMPCVLKRINEQIFRVLTPPTHVEPASASNPELKDRFASAGYNASFKNVKDISSLDDNFVWSEQKIVERTTLVGGFIGVGDFPDAVRKNVIQFVPVGKWEKAFFILPAMGNVPHLEQAIYNVNLQSNDNTVEFHNAQWHLPVNQEGGYWEESGVRVNKLLFSLAGSAVATGLNINDLKFVSTFSILQEGKSQLINEDVKAFTNGVGVASPSVSLTAIEIDPAALDWYGINTDSDLLQVQVRMDVGRRTWTGVLKPISNGANKLNPQSIIWLVSNSDLADNKVKITVVNKLRRGRNITKVIEDLGAISPGLSLPLENTYE